MSLEDQTRHSELSSMIVDNGIAEGKCSMDLSNASELCGKQ